MKYQPKYGGQGLPSKGKMRSPKGKGVIGKTPTPMPEMDHDIDDTFEDMGRDNFNQKGGSLPTANADGTISPSSKPVATGYKKPSDGLTTIISHNLKAIKVESANPTQAVFERYCCNCDSITPFGVMDHFIKEGIEPPDVKDIVALMEMSQNFVFTETKQNVYVVKASHVERLIEHARHYLADKRKILSNKNSSNAQKSAQLTEAFAKNIGDSSYTDIRLLPENISTAVLTIPTAIDFKVPKQKKRKQKQSKISPKGFMDLGDLTDADQINTVDESVTVPKSVVASTKVLRESLEKACAKLPLGAGEKRVYQVVTKNDNKPVHSSKAASLMEAAIDATEIARFIDGNTTVNVLNVLNGKVLKKAVVEVAKPTDYKPLLTEGGMLFRFNKTAASYVRSASVKGKIAVNDHPWGKVLTVG